MVRSTPAGESRRWASTPWPSRVITMRRSRVRPARSAMRRRVELVPQSMAATVSVTRSLGEASGHPAPHRIVSPGEVPGVVGVKALDAPAGSAHPSGGAGPVPTGGQGGVTLGRVTPMGVLEVDRVDIRLGPADPAGRLQPTDGLALLVADQPVAGRHRGAVLHQRRVADDHRAPACVGDHHLELEIGSAPEQPAHHVGVGGRRSPHRRRNHRQTSRDTTATARTGTARLATEPPAASSRSTGSAGADRMGRTWAPTRPSPPTPLLEGVVVGTAAWSAPGPDPPDGPPPPDPEMTSASSFSTNWPSNLLLTSASTPLPNWATLPVTDRSVTIETLVPAPSGASTAVMVALALPWPRVSRPSALSTAFLAVSSRSTKRAAPLYWALMGPTFTLTTPRYSSPSTSCSSAPGMQGAIRSTSVRTAHASSTGTDTRNSLVSSIGRGPPRCRRRLAFPGTLPRPPGPAERRSARGPPRRPPPAAAARPGGPASPVVGDALRRRPRRWGAGRRPRQSTPRRGSAAGRPGPR